MPTTIPLTIYQGSTFVFSFVWKNADGTPVDLTGVDLRMHMRSSVGSPNIVMELSLLNQRIQVAAAEGRVTLAITATDTAALPPGPGVYDLEATFPSTFVDKPILGPYNVVAEVTR